MNSNIVHFYLLSVLLILKETLASQYLRSSTDFISRSTEEVVVFNTTTNTTNTTDSARDKSSKPCPCFDERQFDALTEKIMTLGYDYYKNSCNERKYTFSKANGENVTVQTNELFLNKLDPSLGPWRHAVGYGAQVDISDTNDSGSDGNTDYLRSYNKCSAYDTRRVIEKEEAQSCLSIINQGCQNMRSQICPCFNIEVLRQPTTGIDPERSCRRGNDSLDIFGIYLMNSRTDALPLYGVEKDMLGRKCIGPGMKIKNLNKGQYLHCTQLLEYTCINDYQLDQFSCKEGKFRFRGKTKRWCRWVGKKEEKKGWRCKLRKMAARCPLTCNGRCPAKDKDTGSGA